MVYINESTLEMCFDMIDDDNSAMEGWFECDDLIADTIVLLNKKGYDTVFSCQGHISTHCVSWEEDYETHTISEGLTFIYPYIGFKGDIKLPNIPDGWKLSDDEVSSCICIHNFDYIDNFLENEIEPETSPIIKFHQGLIQLMYDLYKWAQELPDLKINNERTDKMINYKEWKGCYLCDPQPAVKYDGRYLTHRNDEDCLLVTNKFDVIQVEDWCKWYGLYYLTRDESGNEILVRFTFGDIINGVDHYYFPNTIVEFAKVNNLKIDAVSYIAICKMYIEDALLSANDTIDDIMLPSIEDLASVIEVDPESYHSTFYISGRYDVCNWKQYAKP